MRYKGFTLIEVLIVVIIIGILATLMLPQIGSLVEKARTAEAKNMIGALRSLLTVYYMESSNKWPFATTNTAINNLLGQSIDIGSSLFNYDVEADGIGEAKITATRNNRKWAAGSPFSTLTVTINGSGGIVSNKDLTVTWSNTGNPLPPDSS